MDAGMLVPEMRMLVLVPPSPHVALTFHFSHGWSNLSHTSLAHETLWGTWWQALFSVWLETCHRPWNVVQCAFGRLKTQWHCFSMHLPMAEQNVSSLRHALSVGKMVMPRDGRGAWWIPTQNWVASTTHLLKHPTWTWEYSLMSRSGRSGENGHFHQWSPWPPPPWIASHWVAHTVGHNPRWWRTQLKWAEMSNYHFRCRHRSHPVGLPVWWWATQRETIQGTGDDQKHLDLHVCDIPILI